MLSNGKELLGELYGRDHLTYEEIEDLELTVVTENGETVSSEELRGKIFRIVDRDEPSGYVVKNMETTGEGTTICYLQATSS
jgi:ribosomal protein S24E